MDSLIIKLIKEFFRSILYKSIIYTHTKKEKEKRNKLMSKLYF